MLIKTHKSYRNVVAICDSDLIGKKFEQGNMQIDLSGEFFNGEEKTGKEALSIIKDAVREDATFNIVGEQSCALAIQAGIIEQKGVKKIHNMPVALTLL